MIDKQKSIEKLSRECIDSVKKRFGEKTVFLGEGDLDSKLVLVGEAPGEQEEKQKRPFVGQAGKNLQKFLDIVDLERKDIYITNVVKFRPYKINPQTGRKSNRAPNRDEIELCSKFLLHEIDIISPNIIVTLGNTALKVFMGNSAAIGDYHGRGILIQNADMRIQRHIFCLYHPASIIYRKDLLSIYEEDLGELREYLKKNDRI